MEKSLPTKSVTLLDGGMGKELQRMGAPFRNPEWSALALMDDPGFVAEAHANFIAAGAEVITTNAYAVVPHTLGPERFAQRGADLAHLSTHIAKAAAEEADHPVAVAACLPPLFGSYQPQQFNEDLALEHYKILVEAQDEHIDIWLHETISSLIEFETGNDSIRKYRTRSFDAPIWASFTLDDSKEEPTLRSGEPLKQVIRTVNSKVDAVLFNCSRPETISRAVQAACTLLDGTQMRVGAYANAFVDVHLEDQNGNTPLRNDLNPESYLGYVEQWISAGATLIGGCCGIGPEHTQAIRNYLDK